MLLGVDRSGVVVGPVVGLLIGPDPPEPTDVVRLFDASPRGLVAGERGAFDDAAEAVLLHLGAST